VKHSVSEHEISLGSQLILSRTDLRSLGIWQSNTTLLRLEAKGLFPRRLKIGGTATAWDHKEILDWFEERRIERARWVYANAE
jgi:predicted DNA-binding transcriptional regulator AlpA